MASSAVDTLMEMGFARNRAEKALAVTNNSGVESAMEWLLAHSEDPDIDEPYQAPEGNQLGTATPAAGDEGGEVQPPAEAGAAAEVATEIQQPKSLKCEECGKLLKSELDVQAHAARTGHSSFAESTEEIKPLTEEEKKQQLAKLQEKLQQRRNEKQEQAKMESISKEKQRRKQGQDLTAIKQKRDMDEMKKIAEEKKREKMEEKMARQRVRDQIEQDKADRALKYGKTPTASAAAATETPQPQPLAAAAPAAKKDYSEARLQIRLPSGSSLTQTFGASEPLAAVRLFTEMNCSDTSMAPFTFMTTFPRKVFSDEDMDSPLTELGLVPSSVLVVKTLK